MRRTLTSLAAAILVAVGATSCGGADEATLQVDDGPLVYVAMGNSITFYPPGTRDAAIFAYRGMLEEDFAVEVELRNHTQGAQRTDQLLDWLQNRESLRSDLTEADVVTLLIPNDEWRVCGEERRGDLQCLRDAVADYEILVDAILTELTALADPSEVLIRIQDFHVYHAASLAADGLLEETSKIWEEAQDYVEEAAGRYGIPVAQVFDEFMGPDGTDIPQEKGLVGFDDLHPSDEGGRRIAALLHDLGYGLAA